MKRGGNGRKEVWVEQLEAASGMEADTEIPPDRFRPADQCRPHCLSIYSRIGAGLSREVLGGHSGRILDSQKSRGKRFLLWRFMRARRRRYTTRTLRRRRRVRRHARAARMPPRRSAAAKDAAHLALQISPPPREFDLLLHVLSTPAAPETELAHPRLAAASARAAVRLAAADFDFSTSPCARRSPFINCLLPAGDVAASCTFTAPLRLSRPPPPHARPRGCAGAGAADLRAVTHEQILETLCQQEWIPRGARLEPATAAEQRGVRRHEEAHAAAAARATRRRAMPTLLRTQFVFKTHTSFAPSPVHLHLTGVLLLPAAQQRAARRAPSSAAELSAQPRRAPPLARPRAEHDALNPAAISHTPVPTQPARARVPCAAPGAAAPCRQRRPRRAQDAAGRRRAPPDGRLPSRHASSRRRTLLQVSAPPPPRPVLARARLRAAGQLTIFS